MKSHTEEAGCIHARRTPGVSGDRADRPIGRVWGGQGRLRLAIARRSLSRFFRRAALCGLVAGLLLERVVCEAALPLDASEPMRVTNWQTRDGLPSNKVMAVAQTSDGYIWAGTYEGLARFDGKRFERVESSSLDEVADTSVTALLDAPDGSLWIGHSDGSVSRYDNGRFERFPAPERYRGVRVWDLAMDAAGDVWSMSAQGVVIRARDGHAYVPQSGASRGVLGLAASENGDLWVNCRGSLARLRAGVWQSIPIGETMDYYVHGIASALDGGVWVLAGGALWKFEDGVWRGPFGDMATRHAPAYVFSALRSGQLFAGTSEEGAVLISPKPFEQRRLWRETAFASDWILAVCEDREGGLWIATGTDGLFRLAEEELRLLAPDDAWGGRTVLSVAETASGDLWATTEGVGVYRYRNGSWKNFSVAEGISNPYVWSVCEAPDGRLLVGAWGGGLFEKRGNRFVPANGFKPFDLAVSALYPSAFGGVLVGSLEGALRYEGDTATWLQEDRETRLQDVRYFLEDADGTIWLACNGDGLGRIDQSGTRRYTRKDGLPSNYLRCLYRAPDGALWIGTRGAGLSRFKSGRFMTVTQEQGLLDDTICHIGEDGLGNLWIGTLAGVMRVSLEELNACADGTIGRVSPLSFGMGASSMTLACSGPLQPAGYRLSDGDLIFATGNGLARIDPTEVQKNPIPPPVEIQSIKVGGRTVYDGGVLPESIVANPGENRLEIEYTALSFDAPERVEFRRELRGASGDWMDRDRKRSAVYSFLPHGEYEFRVTAANADNVWNHVGASVRLTFEPYFWQTPWFRVGAVLLVLGAVSATAFQLSRVRHRKAVERIERSRALEQERARIANDMHDDLGAHLTRITMLSETAQSTKSDEQKVRRCLGMIYDTAKSVTLAMDEIVWAVNPRHDSFESLVAYFEKFAQDLLASADMRCRLEMPLEQSSWRPNSEVRHNLFLAFKEALNNAIRHSGGSQVTVKVELDAQWCRVTVSDDGRGVADEGDCPSKSPDRIATGNGVGSMRERMRRLAGAFDLGPSSAGGVEVVLQVPMRKDELG